MKKFMLLLMVIGFNCAYANKVLITNIDNNAIKYILDNTGLIIPEDTKAIIIYKDKDNYSHYELYDSIDNPAIKENYNKIENLNYISSSNDYPIKKYYIKISKLIDTLVGANGKIDLEYEIMLARSYDGDLGAKNKKYLNVLLSSGSGINSGEINDNPRLEWVIQGWASNTWIMGLGNVIKNITLGVKLDDLSNQVIIEDYIPEAIAPKISKNFTSSFQIGFMGVSPYSIPIPSPSWSWSNSINYQTEMYTITSTSKGNSLQRNTEWELTGSPLQFAYKEGQEWWSCVLSLNRPECYSYYDPKKLKLASYLYDKKPKLLVRYAANPDYNGKSILYLSSSATIGSLLSSLSHESFYEPFNTIRALNNSLTFDYDDRRNTTRTINDLKSIAIDWSSPVFEQYYPTIFKFASSNLCMANNNQQAVVEDCLSDSDINLNRQKWLFDSENKLIRSFTNAANCLSYDPNTGNFNLNKCDVNKSDNAWFAKVKKNDQYHALYYKDKYINVQNNKLYLSTTPDKVFIKLPSY